VFGAVAQRQRARAVVERSDDIGLARFLDDGNDSDVLAAQCGLCRDVGEFQRLGVRVDEDDVRASSCWANDSALSARAGRKAIPPLRRTLISCSASSTESSISSSFTTRSCLAIGYVFRAETAFTRFLWVFPADER
jgi:hypothetical protein